MAAQLVLAAMALMAGPEHQVLAQTAELPAEAVPLLALQASSTEAGLPDTIILPG
jgi:hypothetical protein